MHHFYAYIGKYIISLSHKKLMKSIKLQWLLKEYSNKFDIILMSYNYDLTVSYIKAKHKPDKMIFSYWYKGTYEENKLKELDLRFITFEESTIKNIKFQDCNMEGSRFIKCSFTDCTFAGCNLCGADFRGCNFEHTSFDKAELTAATFPERSVPFLSISVEQLQVIRIDREGVSA